MKNEGIMKKRERIKTVFLYGVFICYILFLIKILFLSRVSLLELFNSQRTLFKSVNLIPLNIPLRRSRDSGVAGATCPEPGATSF